LGYLPYGQQRANICRNRSSPFQSSEFFRRQPDALPSDAVPLARSFSQLKKFWIGSEIERLAYSQTTFFDLKRISIRSAFISLLKMAKAYEAGGDHF
jgi:hypothetical protein